MLLFIAGNDSVRFHEAILARTMVVNSSRSVEDVNPLQTVARSVDQDKDLLHSTHVGKSLIVVPDAET